MAFLKFSGFTAANHVNYFLHINPYLEPAHIQFLSVKLHQGHFHMCPLQREVWLATVWLWASLEVANSYKSHVAMLA